jgi:hypothetical protein
MRGEPMETYEISAAADARALRPILMAVHELLNRLPVTARSRERPGLRIEDGRVVDEEYSGPVLEEAMAMNQTRRVRPESGPYRGVPVVVTPVRDSTGTAIAAIGVVDITGIFDLASLMEHQSAIIRQVCGSDPCPIEGPHGGSGT